MYIPTVLLESNQLTILNYCSSTIDTYLDRFIYNSRFMEFYYLRNYSQCNNFPFNILKISFNTFNIVRRIGPLII